MAAKWGQYGVGLTSGQRERQLRNLSASPGRHPAVIFVLRVLAHIVLEAIGQIKDGKPGAGPALEAAAWAPWVGNPTAKPESAGLELGQAAGCSAC